MNQETKERIMEAAAELFYQKGYHGTTTRAIAAEAGVNEVTLFRLFGKKEALLREIIQNRFDVLKDYSEAFYSCDITYSLEEDLAHIFRMHNEVLRRNRKIMAFLFGPAMEEFDAGFVLFPRGFRQFLISYLETMRDKGKIPPADFTLITEHYVAAHIGFWLIRLRYGDEIILSDIEAMTRLSVRLYSSLLKGDSP